MARTFIPKGRVLTCPRCHAACREGSPYWLMNKGKCDRCSITLIVDMDGSRVAKRNALFALAKGAL
jgi:hypothetical protein